ncbi:MAG: VOC family protein [Gammaproteobacteria bacterium]
MMVSRKTRRSVMFIVSGIALCTASMLHAQPNPFVEVPDWADFSGMPKPGNVSAVAVDDANGRVWIAARCGANDCSGNTTNAPIIGLDHSSGRVLATIGIGQFVWPHGIEVDSERNIWVTDGRAADGRGLQVIKYAPDGRELMRLGQAGIAGDGPDQFSGPTDVAIADDGSIFVTDGHEIESNHRVMKFSPEGEFLMSFGEFGSGPGQFNVPHALAIDSNGRLFVADRDNNRVQIFDANGQFIDQWTQFGRPSGIAIGADDTIYVSDNQSNDVRNAGFPRGIRIGDAETGDVRAFIPDPDFDPAGAQETMAHGIAVDAGGNVYGAEVWGQTVRRYQLGQPDSSRSAPDGDVIGVGNFAHIVEDLDASLAFYRDVLGLEVGVTTEFAANPAIQAMGNTPGAESRIATLEVPGLELGIELIEYRGIRREAQHPHFVDPGAANMSFLVRDLDTLFPAIRDFPGVTILTAGGAPVTIETPNGELHAVFLQDPDGFVVELLDTPDTPADVTGGHVVSGAAFEPAVADTEESIRFYNELLGFGFERGAAFNANPEMAATAGAPGARFRQSRATIPGTSVPIVLIEFNGSAREFHSGRTQDPGTTVLQLVVRDVAALTEKLAAAGVPIVSVDREPVEVVPGLDIAIVRDPNGMLLELVQRSAR